MKNVMITGCAGFIGSYVTEEFLNAGYKVHGVDKMTYAGNRENMNSFISNPNFSFSPSCITMPSHMKLIVEQNSIDWIINLAAETHVDNSIESSDVFVKTNIQGTKSLLDTCRETGAKLLHFSTDEVYGVSSKRAFTEESKLEPKNPYSATKAAADHMIQSYQNTYGTEYIIVRPSNNFGIRQHDEKFIPTIMRTLKAGKRIPVYGKGNQIREWTHARETAKATRFILENSDTNEIYNISSLFHTENMDVVQKVCDALGRNVENSVEYVPDRPGHDFKYSITAKKLKILGHVVSSNFEDDLKEIVDYEFSSIRH